MATDMADSTIQPFDDPALKAALKRALPESAEKAPAALRARIEAMARSAGKSEGGIHAGGGAVGAEAKGSAAGSIGAASDGLKAGGRDVAGAIGKPKRGPMYRIAVAAILLIGFGGLGYQIWQMNRSPYDSAVAIADSTFDDMVKVHTARAEGKAGSDTVGPAALASAGKTLSKQIGRGVFVPDLSAKGWTFDGAGVRTLGSYQVAQLFYKKDGKALSVFSLPASAASGAPEGQTYEKTFSGSAIAGFVKEGGLFCIVGGAGVSMEEVRGMIARQGPVEKG